MLKWLRNWVLDQCDGDWEREHTIVITTINNPGWMVTIDFSYTGVKNVNIPYTLNERSDSNWIGYSVENYKYSGVGDPEKLDDLIGKFREIWESNQE